MVVGVFVVSASCTRRMKRGWTLNKVLINIFVKSFDDYEVNGFG